MCPKIKPGLEVVELVKVQHRLVGVGALPAVQAGVGVGGGLDLAHDDVPGLLQAEVEVTAPEGHVKVVSEVPLFRRDVGGLRLLLA